MSRNQADEKLVEMALAGETDAFGEIVRRWERKIFALCYGMLGGDEEARDAAQETFISAFRNLNGFRGDAKVSSWLHRIAVNQCLTRLRRQKTRNESPLESDNEDDPLTFFADNAPLPSGETEQKERIDTVRKAIGALPPELKQIVVMKEFEEMTFQEISEILEIPLSTVKSRLYTALKQLKKRLEKTPLEVV
ncbi:MAG: sigma-70 family RNA polymerase sigma factor [Acidobacteriota bacterium]|nr:sigma-70 family RNA polymerase sigma factor [Acidobacteriota bacterium]